MPREREESAEETSKQEKKVKNFSSRLQNAIKSKFCCTGSLVAPVKLFTEAQIVSFPTKDASQLEKVIALCSKASFGKGAQEVTDEEYRKAFVLEPAEFATNFHPSEHGILQTIQAFMCPETKGICAQLYKLNIYPEKGKFKPHVDTPRGKDMIGSLVVCLPFPHKGGALTIKNRDGKEIVDFSSMDPSWQINWTAFFADCEHEIEEVTAGYRVVLTYNLFSTGRTDMAKTLVDKELYDTVGEVLNDPLFLPNGGKLMIACRQNYSTEVLADAANDPSLVLKGADATVYQTLLAHGLKVQMNAFFAERGRVETLVAPIPSQFEISDFCASADCSDTEVIQGMFGAENFDNQDTVFVDGKGTKILGGVSAAYGNSPSTSQWYYEARMVATIPKRS